MTIPLAIMGSLCFIYSHKLHLSSTRKVDFPWRLKGDQSLLASDTQFWWHWWKNELHFPVIIHVLSYFKIRVTTNLYAGLAQISGVKTSTSYWHVCTSFTDKIYRKNVERKYMYVVKSECICREDTSSKFTVVFIVLPHYLTSEHTCREHLSI